MKGWIIAIGAFLASIVGIFFYGKSSGKSQQRADQNEELLKNVSEGKKSDDVVSNMSDAQRREWLRKHAASE